MKNSDLFEQYAQTRDVSVRNRIVENYLYMVDVLVRKYLGKGAEYDDLYQVGAMALVLAVDRFDVSKGFEFTSFATPTILGELKKYFRDKEWSVTVPRRIKELSARLPKAAEALYQKLGRAATVAELSEDLKAGQDEVLEALEVGAAYDTFSLDRTFEDAGDEGEKAFLEKYLSAQEEGYENVELSAVVDKVLLGLNETEAYIFRKRFLEDRKQKDVAEDLGISQMTVSRAEKGLRKKLKEEFFR